MNETAEGRAAIRESKFGHLTVGTIMETQVQSATKDTKAEMLASYMMEKFSTAWLPPERL